MFQCHVFNSFTRLDSRQSGAYILSQFIGGMAAPLFLFMAGMTSGFQMESLERRQAGCGKRFRAALWRAGYIFLIAYLFRLTNWLGSLPNPSLQDLLKVDILNCMGLAMAAFAFVALFDHTQRLRLTVVSALAVAAAAPLLSGLVWTGVPPVVRNYLVPSPNTGQFPFFPCAAYLGFGIAAGSLVKRTDSVSPGGMDRLMQWLALLGFGLVFTSEYFANLPWSVYPKSDFWRNSPALILIRVGVILAMLAGAYLWTGLRAASGWSWIESLGKTSLLVYWVHVTLVYGGIAAPLKRTLTPAGSALAAIVVTLLMVALSEARLRYRARNLMRWKARTTVAGTAEA
jgi:peptidoglycan/LPS O-acetylase OafA/YrhL